MDNKNVDAVFPLSPMQRGMLLHALHAPGEDPGALHLRCTLTGELDLEAFRYAVAHVTQRHPVLRTIVRWKGLDEPLQIVLRTAELPIAVEDLRQLDVAEQHAHLEAYRDADREQGLDLSRPHTSRIALFQTGDTAWKLIWSCHHALLDGWSGALLLKEVVAVTNACQLGTPVELASAPPFQDYVRWLRRQPEDEAEAFWTNELSGITSPTLLPLEPVEAGRQLEAVSARMGEVSTEVTEETATQLRERARQHQMTLSALLHGAWGIVLSGLSGETSVVFGSTTSGRAIDLPGVEAMVGTLINTLPVRVEVPEDASALDVCRQVHASQSGRDRFSHSSPAQVQQWSEVPPHQRLYDSLLVVENYPASMTEQGPIRVDGLQGGITSAFPITVIVTPGETLGLHLLYAVHRFDDGAARQLLTQFVRVLKRICEAPEVSAQGLVGAMERGGQPREGAFDSPFAYVGRETPLHPAASQTEQTLVDIWEEVLNVSPISVTDEFFEMGGDSISSLQIIARANEEGLTLKASDFFEHPTIRELAKALDLLMPTREENHLVPLAPEGTQPPLFIIHGWGGKVFKYRALARRLGADQPVYGVQDVEHDRPESRFASFDAMIDRYVSVIRAQQPHGPYSFLGFSVGGTIAYALTLRFLAAGEPIQRLFILDTVPYNLPRWIRFRLLLPFMLRRAKHHAQSLARSPSQILRRVRKLAGVFQTEFSSPPETFVGPEHFDTPPGGDYYRELIRYYVPGRCRIPVTLIKTTEGEQKYRYTSAWKYLTGPDLATFTLHTDHDGLILKTEIRNQVADIVRHELERDHRP